MALALALLLIPLVVPSPAAALSTSCLPEPSYAFDDGYFFSQTGSDSGLGYYLVNDSEASFLTAFREAGGNTVLGYPVSNRYLQAGFWYQAFQKAILQTAPGSGTISYVNTVDLLSELGRDGELRATRQIPRYFELAADAGLDPAQPGDFAHIMQNHLQLLAVDETIRDFFLGSPRWLDLYGLPVSYEDFGPVKVLRTQRQIIQVWDVPGIGGPVGEAILANTGDIAKEFGLIPESATRLSSAATRAGEHIDASATPTRAGSVAVISIAGTGSQVSPVGSDAKSFCGGPDQQLLLPLAHDLAPGVINVPLEAIGLGPAVRGSVSIEVLELEVVEYPIYGFPDDIAYLFDESLELAEEEFLVEATSPIALQRYWEAQFQSPRDASATGFYGDVRRSNERETPLLHFGTDLLADFGDPVSAAASGVVAANLLLDIHGNTLVLDHGLGVYSIYSHLEEFLAAPGERVSIGAAIATAGSTGRSTGPHLHWELRIFGMPVDTRQWTDDGVDAFVSGRAADADMTAEPAPTPDLTETLPPPPVGAVG